MVQPPHSPHDASSARRFAGRLWAPLGALVRHPVLVGFAALLWLLVRTGSKPSRFGYPCQQAALRSAGIALAVALGPWALPSVTWAWKRKAQLASATGLLVAFALGGISDRSAGLSLATHGALAPASYNADVYVVGNAGGPSGDHFLGIDQLVDEMGEAGLDLFQSATPSADAGPQGIVGANDVVLIKVNQQWPERGGTDTDVLKGLIARILEHPDGFHGEIVVVENGQGLGSFAMASSNSETRTQTVLDVVNHFAALGKPVSARLWDDIKDNGVAEYSAGDAIDGYVVGAWEDDIQMAVSYPKFRTPGGNDVSLKYGVWNPVSHTYDNARLKFINLPVLKCHGAYGVTGAVKHHMGTITNSLSTNSHVAVANGGMGAFLAEVRMPDLNILDCIYVLAAPDKGPASPYTLATRTNQLVAGKDPVALDMWAVTNILVPAIVANGYTSYPKQDPTDSTSLFRHYIDRTEARLNLAGVAVTSDLAHITAHYSGVVGVGAGMPVTHVAASPNPFAASTAIRFVARRTGNARLDVFDVGGRQRRSLFERVVAGSAHEFRWDGADDAGHALRAGTYCYRLSGAGGTASGKVTILR